MAYGSTEGVWLICIYLLGIIPGKDSKKGCGEVGKLMHGRTMLLYIPFFFQDNYRNATVLAIFF